MECYGVNTCNDDSCSGWVGFLYTIGSFVLFLVFLLFWQVATGSSTCDWIGRTSTGHLHWITSFWWIDWLVSDRHLDQQSPLEEGNFQLGY